MVTTRPVKRGEPFTRDNIWVKRPGTGELKADRYQDVLGRRAAADLDAAAAERTEANSRPRTPPDPFKARTLVRNWGRDEDPDIAETSQSLQYTTEIDSLKRHAPFMSAQN